MTSLTARPAASAATVHRSALLALAGLEARRYARHPLFLTGAGVLAVTTFVTQDDLGATVGDTALVPAFLLGLLGVLVGYQLTRSMQVSADAASAAPVDQTTRTAALCLACLVPGAAALLWLTWTLLALAVWPAPTSAAISTGDRLAMLAAGVAQAVGGPLLGVLAGRRLRLPVGGLLVAVGLVVWVVLAIVAAGRPQGPDPVGLAADPSRAGTVLALHKPYVVWAAQDTADGPFWVNAGSPAWYLAYLVTLCGLAATAALLHGSSGAPRGRLTRVLAVLALLAAGSLVLACAPDPARVLL